MKVGRRKGCVVTFRLGGTSPHVPDFLLTRLHNRYNLTMKADQNLRSSQLVILSMCPGMFPLDASTVSSILRKGDKTFSVAFCRPKARQLLQLVDAFTPGSASSELSHIGIEVSKRQESKYIQSIKVPSSDCH